MSSASSADTVAPFAVEKQSLIRVSLGVKTWQSDKVGVYVTGITNNGYIKVAGVDFGDNQALSFTACVASGSDGGTMELHLDSADGPEIGSLAVPNTGGWYTWKTETVFVSRANGVHDLYFVFEGGQSGRLFNFDYWRFNRKSDKR